MATEVRLIGNYEILAVLVIRRFLRAKHFRTLHTAQFLAANSQKFGGTKTKRNSGSTLVDSGRSYFGLHKIGGTSRILRSLMENTCAIEGPSQNALFG